MTSFTTYQWNFHNAVFHQYMIPFFVGSVMLMIGILSFPAAAFSGSKAELPPPPQTEPAAPAREAAAKTAM